jgi:hypothetical protein
LNRRFVYRSDRKSNRTQYPSFVKQNGNAKIVDSRRFMFAAITQSPIERCV